MQTRIDTDAIKRDCPLEEVATRYGVALRPVGRALVGRCPFHRDGGRPNLYVYPASRTWYCYRCAIGGDVIGFVERIEGVGFREAVARLVNGETTLPRLAAQPPKRQKIRTARPRTFGPAERACLAAAVEFYHNQLLGDPNVLAYVTRRGIDRATIERCRVGYASGDELVAYLRWRRVPVQAAVRVGLLRRDGREAFAGRIVVPELRGGQPIWLIGRALADENAPKYLGLPGAKPLLGWELAAGHRAVILVEGIFDWLTLVQWGFPALALVGTHVSGAVLDALATCFTRLYLAFDADDAGHAATERLTALLGNRAVGMHLPPGVKDVAELAPRPDGRDLFAPALASAPELALAA